MAVPTLIVEIAFDDGPFIASPTWTAVTSDVQSVSILRGRSDDFSEDFVSTGTVVLNNNQRQYDPFNALSPYLGKLKPRRQIRIRGNTNLGNRTNLLQSPSFETNSNYWFVSGSGSTLAASTLRAYSGTTSGLWQYPSTLASPVLVAQAGVYSYRVPVTAGQPYTFSVYLFTDVADDYRLDIRWATAITGGSVTDTTGTSSLITANSWTRYSVTGTAPAGYPFAQLHVNRVTNTVTGTTYVDGALFEQSSTAGTYFDGATSNASWSGTAHASTSTLLETYDIFRGFVNGFPVSWENTGKTSTVTLDMFDILALIGTTELKGDLAEVYTKSLLPVHYYRCSEPSGTTTLKDLGSANQNVFFVTSNATTPTSYAFLGMGLSGTSINIENSYFGKSASVTATSGDITISLWSAGNGAATRTLFILNGGTHTLQAEVAATGYVVFTVNGTAVQSVNDTYSSTIAHHYLFTYKASTGIATIYVDGVNQTSGTGAVSAGLLFFPTSNLAFASGIYQDVSCFNKVLDVAEIANIYGFGQGSQTETTGARLNRLMMLTDFNKNASTVPAVPVGEYNTSRWNVSDPNTASISGVPEPNEPILDSIQKAIVTEGGHLFVQRDGVLKATSRLFFAGSISEVTFTDIGIGGFRYRDDIDIWFDGDNMRNDVVVKYGIGGASFASGLFDPDSIKNNGRHTLTVDSQTSNETQALALAQYLLRYGIIDPPSVSKFEVGLMATTEQWQTLLGLELLKRITFKRTPTLGTPFSKDMLINAIDFELTPKVWSMKITGSSRYTTTVQTRNILGAGFGTSSTSFVIKDAPEIQTIAVPAYNQDSATFSAQVNAKGFSTTIRFQYSTDPAFGSFTELTPTPSTATGTSWTSTSVSVSGLTNNTTYYMRVKAVSSIGTVYGNYGGFTTYRLKAVTFTASGTWTAPTWGGTASTTAYYAQTVGGGGGSGGHGGGGGGGAGQNSALTATLGASMAGVVGAGGADYANGGSTTLTNLAGSAGGGNTPVPVGEFPIVYYYNGGSSSSGNAGGSGYGDFMAGIYAGGGGGGAGGAGANYSGFNGGAGGASSTTTYYLLGYGSGGGGHATAGSTGTTPVSLYGGGGSYNTIAAQSGVIKFVYYGPTGARSGTGWSEVDG